MDSKRKTKNIGEVLVENKLITPAVLEEALAYQENNGGSLAQYLVAYNFVTEEAVASCMSVQLGVPYLQLRYYTIDGSVLKLIPKVLIEKHWIVPVDCIKNILTVVMVDPLDHEAIREVKEVTGYTVQPFVGLISDIVETIAQNYGIILEYNLITHRESSLPLPEKRFYAGTERRKSIRLPSEVSVHFPDQDRYKLSSTKDVSRHGFLFDSDNALPVGSFITLEINLPKEHSPYPVAAVVQVARVSLRDDNRFDIGVRVVKVLQDDLNAIISYASDSVKRIKPPHK